MDDQAYRTLASLLSRPVTYHPALARAAGGAVPGIFLSHLFYWTSPDRKKNDPEGWIYKSGEEWTEETQLTRSEQETARRRLKEKGLIEEQLRGVPARMYYRVRSDAVLEAVSQFAEILQTSLGETRKQDRGKPANKIAENLQSNKEHSIQQKRQQVMPVEYNGKPDPLFLAVCTACGLDIPLLPSDAKRVVASLVGLNEINATPEEVLLWKDTIYRERFKTGHPWPSQVPDGVLERRRMAQQKLEQLDRSIEKRRSMAREQLSRRKEATVGSET